MSGTEYVPFKPVPGATNILLSHYPTGVDSFRDTRFNLALAGHSHGGQVRLPWYGAVIVPFGVGEYQLGLYNTSAGPLYVGAGIGYFYANVRFCCPPEITVVEIQPEPENHILFLRKIQRVLSYTVVETARSIPPADEKRIIAPRMGCWC